MPSSNKRFSAFEQLRPKKRRDDLPSASVTRLLKMTVALLRDHVLEFAAYEQRFDCKKRTFLRDLKHLRYVLGDVGMTISSIQNGRVILANLPGKLAHLADGNYDAAAVIRHVARALGAPVEDELGALFGNSASSGTASFLRIRAPTPADDLKEVYAYFRDAAQKYARVEFGYVDGRGRRTLREAEPHLVVLHNGRYYLVAFDITLRKAWRYFALDRIQKPYRKTGRFEPRAVPPNRADDRVVGWIVGASSVDVSINLRSPALEAVLASRWQQDQKLENRSDGSATLCLRFEDIDEAVRWALQYATAATIVGPPEVVAAARETAVAILAQYPPEPRAAARVLAAK